ncbi:WD40-repeat-containing domain protein [Cubamyces menziesii]|nr:WD40-repeat-containing domain protein [Cubamyces menziesii]
MKYRQVRTFAEAHAQGVTQVSFSPDGALLASSDLSGKMCIWDPSTGELLHFYTAGTSILSLLWADSDTIICGLADGTIVKMIIGDQEDVSVEGKWCHAYPVEHLALTGRLLASGAHSEVFVWDMAQVGDLFALEREVDPPTTSGDEVLATGLHWGTNRTHWRTSNILLVTYMSHGIYIRFSLCHPHCPRFRASSSLSPDAVHIAVANMVNGFDVYNLDTGAIVLSLFHKVGKQYPAPVLYVHGGNAILGGSTAGVLDLWYVEGALSRKMQTLPVPGEPHQFTSGPPSFIRYLRGQSSLRNHGTWAPHFTSRRQANG